MLYNPPPKWTEELINELPPGEDDRYERKSGQEIDERKFDEFFDTLATEIGAFANSFGGTLFLGIADEGSLVGVPSMVKPKRGTLPIERWLENKIPTLFEMRLQHFRISHVALSAASQAKIGADRTILAIDVFESDLAPHQCKDHRYYYRSNSESRPAPNHYLAFLWGRTNSNMSHVATWWLKDFLNPIIEHVEGVSKSFNNRSFEARGAVAEAYSTTLVYKIDFLNCIVWDQLVSSSVGEYFLNTFPSLENSLNMFRRKMSEFEDARELLERALENSNTFLAKLKDFYSLQIQRERITRSQFDDWDLTNTIRHVLGELRLDISNHPDEARKLLIRYTAYSIMRVTLRYPKILTVNEDVLSSVVAEQLIPETLSKDSQVAETANKLLQLYETVVIDSSNLWQHLKQERFDVAKRYTATFG